MVEYEPNRAIRDLRERENMDQKEFASKISATDSQISGYECGRHRAPLDIRNKIAKIFGGNEEDYRQGPRSKIKIRGKFKNPNKINTHLIERIYDSGLVPTEVCKLIGYSKTAMSHYICGRLKIKLPLARKLAPVLKCPEEELVEWESYLPETFSQFFNPLDVQEHSLKIRKRRDKQEYLEEILRESINLLGEEDREIIKKHYGIEEDKQTLQEIGLTLGMTKQGVDERERKVLKRLREILEVKYQFTTQ